MVWEHEGYTYSDDRSCVQLDAVAAMLSRSYWAGHRPREVIAKSIANSFCLSVFSDGKQIGFARVVTDGAVFAWLCDVIVHEEHRGRGIGKRIMQILDAHPVFDVANLMLGTQDAHGLYERFGFVRMGERIMVRRKGVARAPAGPVPTYTDATPELRRQLVTKLSVPGRHYLTERIFHTEDGCTIVAMVNEAPVGVISVAWRALPAPMADVGEAFIDLIDVDPEHRRKGIGRRLIDLASDRARRRKVVQLRAWTSDDRPESLQFWRSLQFTLAPAEIRSSAGAAVCGFHVAKRL